MLCIDEDEGDEQHKDHDKAESNHNNQETDGFTDDGKKQDDEVDGDVEQKELFKPPIVFPKNVNLRKIITVVITWDQKTQRFYFNTSSSLTAVSSAAPRQL